MLFSILSLLLRGAARIALLGPGGMGKTSLAVATLHDPSIFAEYPQRHFIGFESAHTTQELLETMAVYFGIQVAASQVQTTIRNHLQSLGRCFLVLDNIEPVWDVAEAKEKLEDFLCLLTEIPDLSLLVRAALSHRFNP